MTNRKSLPHRSDKPHQIQIAKAMSALGHPRRVAILDALAAASPAAMTFRELQARTRLSASTLNHHLDPMQAAGLVTRRLRGSIAAFTANCDALSDAVSYIRTRRDEMSSKDRAVRRTPRPLTADRTAAASFATTAQPAEGAVQ